MRRESRNAPPGWPADTAANQKRAAADGECIGPLAYKLRQCCIDFVTGVGIDDLDSISARRRVKGEQLVLPLIGNLSPPLWVGLFSFTSPSCRSARRIARQSQCPQTRGLFLYGAPVRRILDQGLPAFSDTLLFFLKRRFGSTFV